MIGINVYRVKLLQNLKMIFLNLVFFLNTLWKMYENDKGLVRISQYVKIFSFRFYNRVDYKYFWPQGLTILVVLKKNGKWLMNCSFLFFLILDVNSTVDWPCVFMWRYYLLFPVTRLSQPDMDLSCHYSHAQILRMVLPCPTTSKFPSDTVESQLLRWVGFKDCA